ncbi:MAG: hypothetical protein QNJ16_00170 [Rhodobacter sp.]|nr:hypothetical protein [Rhodobacter sp.]
MWRSMICAGALGIGIGSAAAAQDTLDEMLAATSVFDCMAGDTRAVYVFQSDADGNVALLGDSARALRAQDGDFLIKTPDGLREIAEDRYLVFNGGKAMPGTCLNVTDIARGIYPAVTAAYLPGVAGTDVGATGAPELAAAVTVRDLQVRLAERDAAAAEAADRIGDLQAKLTEADAAGVAAEARIGDLQADVDAAEAAAIEAADRIDGLQADLAAAVAAMADAEAAIEALQSGVAELEEQIAAETEARLAEAAMVRDLQMQLTATVADLRSSESERRAVVASAAMLGDRTVSLEGKLKGARDDAEEARTEIAAMQNLADAAVLQIATMQRRDPKMVRAEVCWLMQGARPGLCR